MGFFKTGQLCNEKKNPKHRNKYHDKGHHPSKEINKFASNLLGTSVEIT